MKDQNKVYCEDNIPNKHYPIINSLDTFQNWKIKP